MLSRKIVALFISSSLALGTVAPVFAESIALPVSNGSLPTQQHSRSTSEYHLSKYDVINIVIIGFADGSFTDTVTSSSNNNSNYFNDLMIGPDGYVNLPYAGNVKLAGLTTNEATQILTAKLGEYIKIPGMSVMVKQYGPRNVYVMGEVSRPGVYSLGSDYMNVFSALSSAGGITKHGRPKHIGVVRMIEGKVQMQEINLDNFIEKQDASQNPILLDGDMLYVPRSNKLDLNDDIMPILSGYGLFRSLTR